MGEHSAGDHDQQVAGQAHEAGLDQQAEVLVIEDPVYVRRKCAVSAAKDRAGQDVRGDRPIVAVRAVVLVLRPKVKN